MSNVTETLKIAELPEQFVLLHRPRVGDGNAVELLAGPVRELMDLSSIPTPDQTDASPVFLLVPYRAAGELGLHCRNDDAPLVAMRVHERRRVRLPDLGTSDLLPPDSVSAGRFDVSDAEYEEIVRRVVTDEIGNGEGANFVISRSFLADIPHYSTPKALAIFQHLLHHERGAYWTFLIHMADRTLVGATPERHITLSSGVATMNPISGTFRYPRGGPTMDGLVEFLDDGKETDELYMALDEELKMMAEICDTDVRVVGPELRMMSHLAHTEYFISGRTALQSAEILRRSLFAPTVVGSPLINAFRVISRYERTGRGYYSGFAALISRSEDGSEILDSAIMIRTAEIRPNGRLRVSAGATVVRRSRPADESAETQAKARGLLTAMGVGAPAPPPADRVSTRDVPDERALGRHPTVQRMLRARNAKLNRFWFEPGRETPSDVTVPGSPRVLVLDMEDTFTSMLAHHVRALGCPTMIQSAAKDYTLADVDCVLLGPGPGNPSARDEPRIARMHEVVRELLAESMPFMAVCLSHQILSAQLGLPIHRRSEPHQGMQREITLFGEPELVGSYNTYFATSDRDLLADPAHGRRVELSRDPLTGEVYALRSERFCSVQFHLESVLTRNAKYIAARLLTNLCAASTDH